MRFSSLFKDPKLTIHTPLTTDVRAAYAAGEDFDFGFDIGEGRTFREPPSYADRALGFDRWLEATIAVAHARGVAEGKAAAAAESDSEKDSL